MNKKETEIFTLKKSEELSSRVSYWYALMQETRKRLLRVVENLKEVELQ